MFVDGITHYFGNPSQPRRMVRVFMGFTYVPAPLVTRLAGIARGCASERRGRKPIGLRALPAGYNGQPGWLCGRAMDWRIQARR